MLQGIIQRGRKSQVHPGQECGLCQQTSTHYIVTWGPGRRHWRRPIHKNTSRKERSQLYMTTSTLRGMLWSIVAISRGAGMVLLYSPSTLQPKQWLTPSMTYAEKKNRKRTTHPTPNTSPTTRSPAFKVTRHSRTSTDHEEVDETEKIGAGWFCWQHMRRYYTPTLITLTRPEPAHHISHQ